MNQQSMLPETEAKPKRTRRREEITLAEFLDACKAVGEKAIPADDPTYRYTERAGIPDDFLEIAWLEFRERHLDNPTKKYRDWRAAFRNAVRDNWYRLWRYAHGECVLTVQGEQAAQVHGKTAPRVAARGSDVARVWAPSQADRAAINAKATAMLSGSSPRRPSRHSGFDQIDYREGVNEDGSF
ncbi:hypothetical protein F3J16_05230 [Burkholderia sp. Ap-962]|uniref:hypothetical protein n=1 Tax=Burkholderia sp. Ap-962 TaxID=2608333 RepID=UPI00142345CB|nr:hypothetical protein [Burkholderia sp. Ap-962]NIF69597.1 hypothetical protein [Burkholderia sp. Ap-962]